EEDLLARLDADLVRRARGLGVHQSVSWLEDGCAGEQEGPEARAAGSAGGFIGKAGALGGAAGQGGPPGVEEPQGEVHAGDVRLLGGAAVRGRVQAALGMRREGMR